MLLQVFGVVEEKEGLETLAKINEALVDDKGRPFKDIRFVSHYIAYISVILLKYKLFFGSYASFYQSCLKLSS